MLVYPRKMAPKKSTKKSTAETEHQIREYFQGRGVLDSERFKKDRSLPKPSPRESLHWTAQAGRVCYGFCSH